MSTRKIKQVIASEKVNMGGIILDQPLPTRKLDMVDPFLLIHHWSDALPGGKRQKDAGVGPHPHRGFTPVTFIFQGGVHHRDSLGTESIINAGGTQWMNSGKGIIHSERPTASLAEKGGHFEIIQFWVNTPAKHKMDAPSYQPLKQEDTPVHKTSDGLVQFSLVAGEAFGLKGKVHGQSPLLCARIHAQADGSIDVPVPAGYNALIYVLNGSVQSDAQQLKTKDMAVYDTSGSIGLNFKEDTRLILLAGEPINEPVVSYGPFVMNSEQEIMQAIQDYQSGAMGELVEKFDT